MSAERKVQILAERVASDLSPRDQARLATLVRRKDRLRKAEKDLLEDHLKFYRQVAPKLEDYALGATKGFAIGDKGELLQLFCTCPVHQAELYGITVSAMLEEMIRQKLVPPKAIPALRQQAYRVDKKLLTGDHPFEEEP